MNIDQLRQLDAVAELGTVSAAAERLRISQPALSRSLARLEGDLGCVLLDRNGRSVALNHAGRTALEYARSILHEERLMRIALDELAHRATSLLVGDGCARAALAPHRPVGRTLSGAPAVVAHHAAAGCGARHTRPRP